MKKIVLFAIMLIAANSMFGQLKVETTGNVKVSKSMAIGTSTNNYIGLKLYHVSIATTPYYGIQSIVKTNSAMPTSSIYGVYGFADATTLNVSNLQIGPIVGVFGKAKASANACTNFNAGVAGMTHYYNGIGVYGGIGSSDDLPLPTTSKGAAYAGYFDGNVKVASTLTAAAVSTTSDARLKDNIQYLSSSTINVLNMLRPITYNFKNDSSQYVYVKGAKEMDATHYGLVAQDVQQVLPDIVYEGNYGYLSVNYTELIPLLIKAVQELSEEVDELKAKLDDK